jgi:hypothetical protein
MYSNDEKTDIILIYDKCNKTDNKHFPKNSSFFHNFI